MRIFCIILSVILSLQLHVLTAVNNIVEIEKDSTSLFQQTVTEPVSALSVGDGQNITTNVELVS